MTRYFLIIVIAGLFLTARSAHSADMYEGNTLQQAPGTESDDQPPPEIRIKSSHLIALGDAHKNIGNLKGAESRYREAIHVDPSNFDAWWKLALLRHKLGDYEAAIADLGVIADRDYIRKRAKSAKQVADVFLKRAEILAEYGEKYMLLVNEDRARAKVIAQRGFKIKDPATGGLY